MGQRPQDSVNTELETRGERWNYPPENDTNIGLLSGDTSIGFSRAFVRLVARLSGNSLSGAGLQTLPGHGDAYDADEKQ